MERLVFILFDFGYAIIFGILSIACLFIKIPKESGIESYVKARRILGGATALMTAYCVLRLIFPQRHTDYEDFWLLTTVTLVFSWLSYSSALFLMETPRYLRRNFFLDGIFPTTLMIILGVTGLIHPPLQKYIQITFGLVFGIKCVRMFYVCEKEYRICEKDVNNSFGQRPDIKWIHKCIYVSFALSLLTIAAFYITAIQLVYYIFIPIVYTYIVIKVIGFMPATLDRIRTAGQQTGTKEDAKGEKTRDLVEKIGPKVEEWIENKGFCTPDMTIKDVAMQMGTNHNYLSTYLNKHLQMTFQVWLHTLRIEESKKLLTSGEKLSIEEVGVRVGIPLSYNFSRWFRVITDMTPYQYRRQHS